jgi:hypothetical protein
MLELLETRHASIMGSSTSDERANPPERNVLAYASRRNSPSRQRGFPIGLFSLVAGAVGAIGLPAVDRMSRGFEQAALMFAVLVISVLAIGSAMVALCLPGERRRGIIGMSLGAFAYILLLVVTRT